MTTNILLACAISYLIGAIPFGVIATRAKGIDIFQFGSGNPGATNVSRALGKTWGFVIFALDVLKGTVSALIAHLLISQSPWGGSQQTIWFVAGLFSVLGHCYSVFLRFRGGKGIATSLGVGIGACPLIAVAGFGIFVVVFAVTRYISLASIVAVPSAVVFAWVIPGQARELIPLYALLTAFVIYRHRANIRRLLAGTEPKFEFKKKQPKDPSPDEETTQGEAPGESIEKTHDAERTG